jgi:hypothetical protein
MPSRASSVGRLLRNLLKWLWKHREEVVIVIGPVVMKMKDTVREWWKGKKVAVLGPAGVGKSSLYRRLKGQPFNSIHVPTRGADKLTRFTVKYTLPDGKLFKVTFKGCISVGGDTEECRHWPTACMDADVIFYMVTIQQLINREYEPGSLIHDHMKWLAGELANMKPSARMHLLVNKIDTELSSDSGYKEFVEKVTRELGDFEDAAKKALAGYASRLTGVTPTSMKEHHIYIVSIVEALNAIYDAVHPVKQ